MHTATSKYKSSRVAVLEEVSAVCRPIRRSRNQAAESQRVLALQVTHRSEQAESEKGHRRKLLGT